MTVLKTILKFALKQLRHVSVQSRHLQGAHYPCLLKLLFVKIHQCMIQSVVMWLHTLVVSLLMCVMSHCSGVDFVRYCSQVIELSLVAFSTVKEWS